MDKNSNKYTFIYSILLVVIVATVLTFIAVGLGPRQEKNVELEKKANILKTINISSTTKDVEDLYNKYIVESFVVNRNGENVNGIDAFTISLKEELRKEENEQNLPVYIAKLDDGSKKYIFTLNGKGLWGGIWGYISLDSDLNTVYGVNFDHASETPGLGAEISTAVFQVNFKGKKIFDENNNFVSIDVSKKVTEGNIHAVDAVSGGTITSNGVRDMLKNCLNAYLGYIKKVKN
ncbi:MAG: NADH:ubiquinone reductase (Na(+)-transporting) subunit C [Bacteroidales bacterium]|jgi:Na+-transporting NADH:ubiquinone oxidoreductase subunit C|nr:NADH:ubiquinone reductase (Na(+)-transporting) subunit C [Bacteroidales bacterium]